MLHEKGPRGRPIAIPANFLIDRDGHVAWEYISARVQQRMNPADLLKEVQTRAGSEPPGGTVLRSRAVVAAS